MARAGGWSRSTRSRRGRWTPIGARSRSLAADYLASHGERREHRALGAQARASEPALRAALSMKRRRLRVTGPSLKASGGRGNGASREAMYGAPDDFARLGRGMATELQFARLPALDVQPTAFSRQRSLADAHSPTLTRRRSLANVQSPTFSRQRSVADQRLFKHLTQPGRHQRFLTIPQKTRARGSVPDRRRGVSGHDHLKFHARRTVGQGTME